jgi:hypothetical protein
MAGCGDSGNNIQLDSGAKGDMAMTIHDLSMTVTKLGCAGFLNCENNCPTDSQASFDACATMCKQNTKSTSLSKFMAALNCGQTWCIGNKDAGTAKCDVVNGHLVDVGATMPTTGGVCDTCLNNSLANLFSATCMPANSPDCNPASCASTVTACMSDM